MVAGVMLRPTQSLGSQFPKVKAEGNSQLSSTFRATQKPF